MIAAAAAAASPIAPAAYSVPSIIPAPFSPRAHNSASKIMSAVRSPMMLDSPAYEEPGKLYGGKQQQSSVALRTRRRIADQDMARRAAAGFLADSGAIPQDGGSNLATATVSRATVRRPSVP